MFTVNGLNSFQDGGTTNQAVSPEVGGTVAAQISINELPGDLLVLIFLAVRQQHDFHSMAPIYLSHVCKLWRDVALAAASLWSEVSFRATPRIEHGTDTTTWFRKQAEWITRSKGALLDIEIRHRWLGRQTDIWFAELILNRILELIVPHSHRWRSLHVFAVQSSFIVYLGRRLALVEVPQLESFSARYQRLEPPTAEVLKPFQGGTPNLKDLSLQIPWPGTFLRFDNTFIHTLSDLRQVLLSHYNFSPTLAEAVRDILDLIRCSPLLESLIIPDCAQDYFTQPRPHSRHDVIHAISLTELAVGSNVLLSSLLPFLQLPAVIRRLSVDPMVLAILHDFHPAPNLKSIVIASQDGPWDRPMTDLPLLLSRMTELQVVSINRCITSAPRDDTWITGFSQICPKLQTLKVDWDSGVLEESIRTLVEDRMKWGNPLSGLALGMWEAQRLGFSKASMDWFTANVVNFSVITKEDFGYVLFD